MTNKVDAETFKNHLIRLLEEERAKEITSEFPESEFVKGYSSGREGALNLALALVSVIYDTMEK